MSERWDEAALTLESTPSGGGRARPEATDWLGGAEAVQFTAVEWGEASTEEEEASVGQWLSNIGQGAATGAVTGLAAGPWGALVGGLLGGGLGAVQTATAPQPPAPSAAQRPAPPRPPQTAPPTRPPAPRSAPRPPTPRLQAPAPAASGADPRTAQLLDQLATLVPVVAALAVQVGQLSQNAQAGAAATESSDDEQTDWAPQASQDDQAGDAVGWGESGEDVFDEGSWPKSPSGEWVAAEDRAEARVDL